MLNQNRYIHIVLGVVLLVSSTSESWAKRAPSKTKKVSASQTLKTTRIPTVVKPKVKSGKELRPKKAKVTVKKVATGKETKKVEGTSKSAEKGTKAKGKTAKSVAKGTKATAKGTKAKSKATAKGAKASAKGTKAKSKASAKGTKAKSKATAGKKASKKTAKATKVLSGVKRLMASLRVRLKSNTLFSLLRSVSGKSLKKAQAGMRQLIAPGNLRASLMGLSDGVASTVGLVIAASMILEPSMLLLTGLGAMIAGASSMSAGEYSSVSYENEQVRAQQTRLEKALKVGRKGAVRTILREIGKEAGVKSKRLGEIQKQIMAKPARLSRYYKELNLNQELASPRGAAVSSFVSFLGGAAIPMAPIILGMTGVPSILVAGGLSAVSLGGVGFGLSKMSGNFSWPAAMRMATTATIGAGVSWVAGMFLGGG